MGNYTQEDIQNMYNEIKRSSFRDIPDKSKLVFKDFKYFGFASPFSFNVLINIQKINSFNLPEEAVRGLIAHECSHQVSFIRRSFLNRIMLIWNYPLSNVKKRKVEKEADEISIERGYAKEMILMRKYKFSCDNETDIKGLQSVYLSVEELEKLITEKSYTMPDKNI